MNAKLVGALYCVPSRPETNTLVEYEPSSAKVWEPKTSKPPEALATTETVPEPSLEVLLGPSFQSTEAVKMLAVALGLAAVKWNSFTWSNLWPSCSLMTVKVAELFPEL